MDFLNKLTKITMQSSKFFVVAVLVLSFGFPTLPLANDESADALFDDGAAEELMLDDEPSPEGDAEGDELLLEDDGEPALAEQSPPPPSPARFKWSGKTGLEYRYFHDHGLDRGMDYHNNVSFSLEPELAYSWKWHQSRQQIAFKPFWRYDQNDSRRTHFDVRELVWRGNWGPVTVHAGIDKVFWGVTESQHTIDIINQTDLIENSDTEDKLGQPMLHLDYSSMKWGTLSLFYLPVSRSRTFPGKQGRLRPPLPITVSSEYRGSASHTHQDFAVRWARTFGYWDVGMVYFRGVTRRPRLRIGFDDFGRPVNLRPVYEIINQLGIDVQGVTGNWLWKLEAFTRSGQGKRFQQLTAGFEYTFSGVFSSGADWGFLMEYLHDTRDNDLPLLNFVPFQNDLFVGTRFALNDVQSTELLAGATIDLDNGTTFFNVEASRRFGDRWKLYLEMRGFTNVDSSDPAYFFRKENYMQVELQYFF